MPLAVSLNGKWDRRVSWNLQSLWKATGVSMCSNTPSTSSIQRRPLLAFMGHMTVGRRQQTLHRCDPSREKSSHISPPTRQTGGIWLQLCLSACIPQQCRGQHLLNAALKTHLSQMRWEWDVVCWVLTGCLAPLRQWLWVMAQFFFPTAGRVRQFFWFLKWNTCLITLHPGFPAPTLRGESWQREHHIHCMGTLRDVAVTWAGPLGWKASRWF